MIKKIFVSTTALTLAVSTVAYAASPTVFPHGISASAPIVNSAGVSQGTVGEAATAAAGAVQANGGDASKTVVTPTGDTASRVLSDVAAQAAGSVQKTSIGVANGVAPLDANKMMSAAVSGDSSASPVSGIIAPGNAVFPSTVTRNVGAHFSDIPTLRDFGMKLAPQQGAQGISWLQNYWPLLDGATPAILPAGSFWPDNAYVPDSGSLNKPNDSDFPVVTAFGSVKNRPGYNTLWQYGVPYYGDVVPSLTHDDASFEFARVDGNFSSAGTYVPVVRVDQILDTPFEGGTNGTGGNQFALSINTTTTPRMSGGTISNTNNTMISNGYNYYGEMDVNSWTHTRINGTNWTWDNIQEMYEETPFYCDPLDTVLCSAEYMNEEDMYGIGPESSASAYDPTDTRRQMFWLTTNHNINYRDTPTVRWNPSMVVPAHKIITVVDRATNHEFMFAGTHTGFTGNVIGSAAGTVNGNTLTVTSTSGTITPGSTYIFGGTISDEVVISSQVSGTPGGTGVYTITSKLNPNGFNIPKTMTFQTSAVSSARFSVTGTTEPQWTFNTGDTFVDGTTTWKCIGPWQYDIGAIIKVGGASNPGSGYVERIGTLMTEETDEIYNAIFDMSKATFDPSVTKIFARLQKNMYLDFTADGTKSGQNNALLGYNAQDNALEYKRNGSVVININDDKSFNISQKIGSLSSVLEITSNAQADQDFGIYGRLIAHGPVYIDGLTTLSGGLVLASKSKADILALTSPVEGTSYYDSDDHEEVTYRCPTTSTCGWFPVQYGTALSN